MKRSTTSHASLVMPRALGLVAGLAFLSACGETPTGSQPLDVLGVSGPSLAMNGNGNGAVVDRFEDDGLILLTQDVEADLYSVHYSNSDVLGAFIGCEVPSFSSTLERLSVLTPTGRVRDQTSGEVYVVVHALAGFPANLCDEAVAEGTIRLRLSVGVSPPGSPGETVASFGSDGVITHNPDGSDVRLHHSRKGLQGPPTGIVRLK